MVVGLILAAGLIVFGVGTAARQRRTLRRLREERFLPSDDRAYLKGQVRRRLATSAVLVLLGGMIGGAFLSGMEARANAIADRQRRADAPPADPEADPGRPPDPPPPPSEEDRQFVQVWGVFWIGVLVLVFAACCLAVFDFWATRKYWMAQYRILKAEHEAKLRRDLAVYRQTKDNARMTGLGRGKKPPDKDDTAEEPPAE
ncbi:MAG: hypothetical protein K2X87_21805 [Gemmataceae bacterium]|nr:hypothetical protein [Gemmataceae bacterium]